MESIYIKKKKKVLGLTIIHLLIGLVPLLWLSGGIFSFISDYIHKYYKLALFFSWLVLAFFIDSTYIDRFIKYILPIFIFYIIMIIAYYIADIGEIYYIDSIQYILTISSMFIFYNKKKFAEIQRLLFFILIFDFIFTLIYTYISLQTYPEISRQLAAKGSVDGINTKGIGGYGFVYGTVIVALFFLYNFFKNEKFKILNLLLYIFCFIFIIQSQYMLALLLLMLFSLILIFILLKSYKVKTFLLLTVIVILILLAFIGKDLFMFLSHIELFPEVLRQRFIQLATFFSGDIAGSGNIIIRLELYWKSITAFFNNILMHNYANTSIGGHSTWFDFLGIYGILAFFYIFFWARLYKNCKEQSDKYKNIIILCFIYYFLLGMINTNIAINIVIDLLIIVPFGLNYIYRQKSDLQDNTGVING